MGKKNFSESRRDAKKPIDRTPQNLASVVRGLYRRVASRLNVDPSYVSRVARGERHSPKIASALRSELKEILVDISKGRKKPKSTV